MLGIFRELPDKLEFRPSATVAYTVAWYDDYRESGTTNSNLTVDERTIEAIHTRVQLAAMHWMKTVKLNYVLV